MNQATDTVAGHLWPAAALLAAVTALALAGAAISFAILTGGAGHDAAGRSTSLAPKPAWKAAASFGPLTVERVERGAGGAHASAHEAEPGAVRSDVSVSRSGSATGSIVPSCSPRASSACGCEAHAAPSRPSIRGGDPALSRQARRWRSRSRSSSPRPSPTSRSSSRTSGANPPLHPSRDSSPARRAERNAGQCRCSESFRPAPGCVRLALAYGAGFWLVAAAPRGRRPRTRRARTADPRAAGRHPGAAGRAGGRRPRRRGVAHLGAPTQRCARRSSRRARPAAAAVVLAAGSPLHALFFSAEEGGEPAGGPAPRARRAGGARRRAADRGAGRRGRALRLDRLGGRRARPPLSRATRSPAPGAGRHAARLRRRRRRPRRGRRRRRGPDPHRRARRTARRRRTASSSSSTRGTSRWSTARSCTCAATVRLAPAIRRRASRSRPGSSTATPSGR